MIKYVLLLATLCIILISCAPKKSGDILVFSKTEGFRHESISSGIKMFEKFGIDHGINIVSTEDASYFSEEHLKNYKVVVFLNTTGDILNDQQQLEFTRFIQAGGGFVGIHAAADTEYSWPWYNQLVGAYFNGHPNNPNVRDGSVDVVDATHISCKHLPARWDRTDEWYNYKSINPDINTVLNLDETSYEGGTNGESHPIAWYHEFDGGRAFYSGGGHTHESFTEENFVQHIWGGVQYAIGDGTDLDYAAANVQPAENRFQKVVLDDYLNEPMELEMLPDGRIVFIERDGDVKLYDPKRKETTISAHINTWSELEDGLLGLALDPNFSENKWLYMFYSHPTESIQHLSRFEYHPDDLDPLKNEVVLLKVPTQRDECCHSAGSMEFGPDGNLYVSTGDNTNPHFSDGHGPIDSRPGRAPFDAQKSSANMNDLRGKILRITPKDDGTYSIPAGNLFAQDGSEGRPEIYVMGCRNPYRFSIDPKTKYVYWGEVGPDANEDKDKYGPRGYDEVNQAKQAGFFGWPLFIANNKPYRKRDFAKDETGEFYDPKAPVNTSRNNTGGQALPPAQPAMVYYPYGPSDEFPDVGTGGRNAMAGPVFYMNDYPDNPNRYPAYYDGKLFIYDWMRGWIKAVSFDENGDFATMEPFLPSIKWDNLIDIIMGPNGDMYMLEYGKGWFSKNPDARLIHLNYVGGNRAPVASIAIENNAGAVPFTVAFNGNESKDFDGDDLEYSWDFGDGSKGEGLKAKHTYKKPGVYQAKLTVKDANGEHAENIVNIYAGNEPPKVNWTINTGNESFYWPGIPVEYSVQVDDKEDGSIGEGIDEDDVTVTIDFLEQGHDIVEQAMGHQAMSELATEHPAVYFIKKSDCLSCHKETGTSIGPSYEKISEKYYDDENAISYLSEKIINGGGGVWGQTAMAAHPDLSEEKAKSMAEYIMSIKGKVAKSENSLPGKGSYVFDKSPLQYPDGKYVLTASYVDRGADGAERMRSQDVRILKPPMIMAVNHNEIENASNFKVTKDMVPNIENDMHIVIVNQEGMVRYQDIDFTNIGSLGINYNVPPPFMGGGTLEIFIDDKSMGNVNVSATSGMAFSTEEIAIGALEGKHDIIIKATAADETKPVCSLIALNFKPAGMTL